jgi:hypothetical protein
MAHRITRIDVLTAAAGLVSESAENAEYDRAITELTCDLIGVGTDHKEDVLALLRLLA